MRSRNALQLYIEVFVCFAPISVNLLFGILILPTWIAMVLSFSLGQGTFADPEEIGVVAWSMFLTVTGVIGLAGVGLLAWIIVVDRRNRWLIRLTKAMVIVGTASLLAFNVSSVGFAIYEGGIDARLALWLVVFLVMPVACTLHLLYLGRNKLFKRTADGQ